MGCSVAGHCLVGRVTIARPVFEYIHAIEGRLRIKVPEVKRSPEVARRVESQFCAIDGVLEVGANPVTGNVLFHYDPVRIEPYAIMETLVTLGYMKETAPAHSFSGTMGHFEGLAPWQILIMRLAVAVTEMVLKVLFRRVAVGLTSRPKSAIPPGNPGSVDCGDH